MGGRWCSQCGSCCTSLYELGSIHATGSRVRTCRLRLANIEGALTSPDWEHPWSMGATPQKSKSPRPDEPTEGAPGKNLQTRTLDSAVLLARIGHIDLNGHRERRTVERLRSQDQPQMIGAFIFRVEVVITEDRIPRLLGAVIRKYCVRRSSVRAHRSYVL